MHKLSLNQSVQEAKNLNYSKRNNTTKRCKIKQIFQNYKIQHIVRKNTCFCSIQIKYVCIKRNLCELGLKKELIIHCCPNLD